MPFCGLVRGYSFTQHGSYAIGGEHTNQENSFVLEANAKMRKMPMPRIMSSHVVSLVISISE